MHFKQKSEVSAAKKLSFTTASAIISKTNPRLLHRWAWATRNNLWKRSWHDTESDSVKWKYRNSQWNLKFSLTLLKATGFSKPLVSNWDEVGPDEVWSNLISPSQQWMGWLFCRHTWYCLIACDQKPEKHIWHSLCVIASTATYVALDFEEENHFLLIPLRLTTTNNSENKAQPMDWLVRRRNRSCFC